MVPRRGRSIPSPTSMRDLTLATAITAADARLLLSSFASRFTIGAVRRAYRMFEGDLVMSLVFGEIAQYNVSHALRSLEAQGVSPLQWRDLLRTLRREKLHPCNALSISEATGIPRETVRRKVKELEQRGWVYREGANKLSLAPAAIRQFHDSGLELLRELMETARVIESLEAVLPGQLPRSDQGSRPSPGRRKAGAARGC